MTVQTRMSELIKHVKQTFMSVQYLINKTLVLIITFIVSRQLKYNLAENQNPLYKYHCKFVIKFNKKNIGKNEKN
jgi:hypothetical protein